VATRQTSSSGKAKSPRIQVVLPEELCQRLADLADVESRTVSNMAKVLIQQGVERLEQAQCRQAPLAQAGFQAELFRQGLEARQGQKPQRLRGAPRRVRLHRPA
jgi:predicted transcriptional regulator